MGVKDFTDLLDILRFEGEELWDRDVEDIYNSIKRSGVLAICATFLALLMITIYCVIASGEYNWMITTDAYQAGKEVVHRGLYNTVYYTSLIVLVLVTYVYTFVMARVGYLSAMLSITEGLMLSLVNICYAVFSAVVPEKIENRFDPKKKIKPMLEDAKEKGLLVPVAAKIIRSYMAGVATALFAFWLILALPLSIFQSLAVVVMIMIAIVILVFQVFGYEADKFWIGLLEQGAMYACVFYLVLYGVVVPYLKYTQVFEGWGPAGHARTGFWFVVVALVAGIATLGLELNYNSEKERYSVGVKNGSSLLVAVLIFAAAALFGNLFLTKVSGVDLNNVIPQITGSNNSGGTTAPNSNELNNGNGPYFKNTDQKLRQNEAYKFPNKDKVYIYEGKLLRPVADSSAYATHYGCKPDVRVIDCHPVYDLPASIKPGDPILQGGEIR